MDFEKLYHPLIIILLLIIIWKITRVETYIGGGLSSKVFTSGADQRFAQQFTSTDQDTSVKY